MKPIDAGQLRKPGTVIAVNELRYTPGFSEFELGEALGYPLYCQWIEAHGSDFQPEAHLRRATLRCRWTPAVTTDCYIRHGGELWEILSCENIRDRGEWMEMQIRRTAPAPGGTVTLWSAGKRVSLKGSYLDREDGYDRANTGRVSSGGTTLIIPREHQASAEGAAVKYIRPIAYAGLGEEEKAGYYTIDSGAFFALGDIVAEGKYQAVNAAYDDVFLVRSVSMKNRGDPIAEYLEVEGK